MKQFGVVLAVASALVMAGVSQEGSVTTDVAVSVEVETYFSEWEGTVTLRAGEATAELSIMGLWTLMLHPSSEGQARVSLSELLVYVPEFAVGGMSGSGFFITESRVGSFDGTVDLATSACRLRGSVSLAGLVRGLNAMAFEASGNLRTGALSVKGTGATGTDATGVIAGQAETFGEISDRSAEAKTWRHYALSELLKAGAAKATCCGCEYVVITTGGKSVTKVESSSKKVRATKGDYTTHEKAVVLIRCECCDIAGDTEESTVTITWKDSANEEHKDTITVVCKKPTTYTYTDLLNRPGPLSLDCKAGECILVTFEVKDKAFKQTVKSVVVKGGDGAVTATKGPLCCKQTNSVLIRCACITADCTAKVVITYFDKFRAMDQEAEITVNCKK
jgi:hypothetical protein